MIRCRCGFLIFDGVTMRNRVAQFSQGYFNVKCSRCKLWLEGLNIKLLTGEVKEDIDFRTKERKVVIAHD